MNQHETHKLHFVKWLGRFSLNLESRYIKISLGALRDSPNDMGRHSSAKLRLVWRDSDDGLLIKKDISLPNDYFLRDFPDHEL